MGIEVNALLERGFKYMRNGAVGKDGCQVLKRQIQKGDSFVTEFRKVADGKVLDREMVWSVAPGEFKYNVKVNGGIGPRHYGSEKRFYGYYAHSGDRNQPINLTKSFYESIKDKGASSETVNLIVDKNLKISQAIVERFKGAYDSSYGGTYIQTPWRSRTKINYPGERQNYMYIEAYAMHPSIGPDNPNYLQYYRGRTSYPTEPKCIVVEDATNPRFVSFDNARNQISELGSRLNIKDV